MIRPSSLGLAEKCSYSVLLQDKFPETSEAADRGNVVDEQCSAALETAPGGMVIAPTDPDAIACIRSLQVMLTVDTDVHSHKKVSLLDPDTGELITEGTPDVQLFNEFTNSIITVDWKKREQYFAGYLNEPDDNLQLHAYSLAKGLATGAVSYQNVLIIFGDGKAEVLEGKVFERSEWPAVIDRIRAIQAKPRIAAPGSHCANCWQRWVCDSYRERAKMGLVLLDMGDNQSPLVGPLTDDQAAQLVERATAVKQAADVALDLAKAHQKSGGRILKDGKQYVPTICEGRESGNLELLRKDGLTKYIKKGASYDRWVWKRVK